MANKRIENAKKELTKWETKAEELTQKISVKESELTTIDGSLGELVISGGDVSQAQGTMDRIRRDLHALQAGLHVAESKAQTARRELADLERAELENTVRENGVQADKLLLEIIQTMETLAKLEQSLADLAFQTTTIKEAHDIRISFGHYGPTWAGNAQQVRRWVETLKHAQGL